MGMDLGGTKLAALILDEKEHILWRGRFPTEPFKGPEHIMDTIKRVFEAGSKESGTTPDSLGLGVAAQISKEGVVKGAPNLPLEGIPITLRLKESILRPVYVTNDVRTAAYGEWKKGSGIGAEDLLVVFVGTGIGGAVVSGDSLLEGCSNNFGELGHTTLMADGRKCRCPNHGCLEAYAGGWAIAERAQEAVKKDSKKGAAILSLAKSVENITAAIVSEAYHKGDGLAIGIIKETGEFLGAGLVGMVNALNPCVLILGGGIIEGIPDLAAMAEKRVRASALPPALEKLEIKRSALGSDAGSIGAAMMAREVLSSSKNQRE